ncbi:MAG TPA: low-specificity L-threonine aldolase [Vicinamibacterales bacterium]|nr:low-specificity L-threonine aldolase [Vicinamibacterales bacterium]
MIDLRSDTVTLPTPAMRRAMADAEVGDDVYREDPTVIRLEALAAELMGKEAALFVPSGTMGNLISVLTHAGRGQEVILGDQSHIFIHEAGGASALGGAIFHTVPTSADATLPLDEIERAIRPSARDVHYAEAAVVCLENTHNRRGGAILAPAYVEAVGELARRRGLRVHLDGARIFNASVATGRAVTDWTRHVSSIQFCLSKGLAAPAGSMIAADRAFIDRARRQRKMLGGGMRQVGILAAAGIIALTEMVDRLAEDHATAQRLAADLAAIPGVDLDPPRVQTNIVIFTVPEGTNVDAFVESARREGVLLGAVGGRRVRAVTHLGISADDCGRAAKAVQAALHALV